jgi:hypothetical protein
MDELGISRDDEEAVADDLIVSFLRHQGFADTLRALQEEQQLWRDGGSAASSSAARSPDGESYPTGRKVAVLDCLAGEYGTLSSKLSPEDPLRLECMCRDLMQQPCCADPDASGKGGRAENLHMDAIIPQLFDVAKTAAMALGNGTSPSPIDIFEETLGFLFLGAPVADNVFLSPASFAQTINHQLLRHERSDEGEEVYPANDGGREPDGLQTLLKWARWQSDALAAYANVKLEH